MPQLEQIEAIERRLWTAADTLRANSNYAANEYFMPVMGLIFLRHAYSRYFGVRDQIVAGLPTRGGKVRELTKEDFSQKTAIFLRPHAQFDQLVSLPDSADRAEAVIAAMESIEADYGSLAGVLPKSEYQELDNAVLGQLLRTLNPEELNRASGDIFGRIYEYFLTQFANQKAHDGGEFFTPISIVQLIVNVIEPEHGVVLDPACGSGGMFVQSAHFVERLHLDPARRLTFYGAEKNATTIRLAKMNLAVHGLAGDIRKAITYYEDPHELLGKADCVMANPPFNVDEVDAESVKNDPRLPFGLPGVNKAGKVSNGNYLWISYFHSYLNGKGRAGFVMSSQASGAGRDEAKVRQKIVETGDVDAMIAIRGNFFYTRTVPCELWFFDKGKSQERRDLVLMLDARNIYRKVTRKIYDFSPEHAANLTAIVWLYRCQQARFLGLARGYAARVCAESDAIVPALKDFETTHAASRAPLAAFAESVKELDAVSAKEKRPLADALVEWTEAAKAYTTDRAKLIERLAAFTRQYQANPPADNAMQHTARLAFDPLAEAIKGMVRQVDLLYKLAARAAQSAHDLAEDEAAAEFLDRRACNKLIKRLDDDRKAAVEQLKAAVYFHRQIVWLQDRFPKAEFQAVPGLCKILTRADIAAADWSLTPGRYVGVAPPEVDEDFDFEQTLSDIHLELADLNREAAALAAKIQENFEGLGV
jgi:type I restriction enzyme M protein